MAKRPVKCPICHEKYVDKPAVYAHMEEEHEDVVPQGMSGGEYFYRLEHGRGGRCVVCHKETKWNYKTNKFNRFCENPACKAKYKADFDKKMIGKYGKTSLADDPEQQKKMLANRRISGKYKWSDGSGELEYTGSYELDFLRYIDNVMEFEFKDIMAPSPHTYTYEYDHKNHFYIPDFYISSLNLEVEIKASDNRHHKIVAVDNVKEKLKDDVMRSQKAFNYIKIYDKDYAQFTKLVFDLKEKDDVTKDVVIIAKDPYLDSEAKKLLAIENFGYLPKEPTKPFDFEAVNESPQQTESKSIFYPREYLDFDDPKELLEFLNKNCSWELVSYKDGKKIHGNEYMTLHPNEFLKYHQGCCWDYVAFENYVFETIFSTYKFTKQKLQNNTWSLYFHQIDDDKVNPSHAWLAYMENGKIFAIESSFYEFRGLHVYKSEEEMVQDYSTRLYIAQKIPKDKEYNHFVFRFKQPNQYHLKPVEYMDYIYDHGVKI